MRCKRVFADGAAPICTHIRKFYGAAHSGRADQGRG